MIKIRSRLALICVHCLTFSVLAGLVTLSFVETPSKRSAGYLHDVFGGSQVFNVHDFLYRSYQPDGYDPNKLDVIAHSDFTN